MTYHVPPSLAWLATKRAHLAGEIIRVEGQLDTFLEKQAKARKHLELLIASLKNDLVAVDAVFALHEIQVNPAKIRPIKQQTGRRLVAWGEVTRGIYRCLATLKGKEATTREIAVYIAICNDVDVLSPAFRNLIYATRKRLRRLTREKCVQRIHCPSSNSEGRWAAGEADWKAHVTGP